MRNHYSKMNRTTKNIIYIILGFLLVSFCSIGYATLNQRLDITGRAAMYVPPVQQDFIVTYDYNIYSENPYNLDATVTITNVGEQDATAWEIYITMPPGSEIRNYYGAELISNEGDVYYFDNPNGTNDYIAVGQSISFHIQYTVPNSYEILHSIVYGVNNSGGEIGGEIGGEDPFNPPPVVDPCEGAFISDDLPHSESNNGLEASYTVGNSWPSGNGITKEVRLTVTNNGITNSIWIAMIDIGEGGTVAGCYEGTCTVDGTNVTIIPPSYASTLTPGQSITKNYHINVINNYDIDLFYIGKTSNGYKAECQNVAPVGGGENSDGPLTSPPTNPEKTVTSEKPVTPEEPVIPQEPLRYGDDDDYSETGKNLSASYRYQSNWNNGTTGMNVFQTAITITNNTDSRITGWTAKFKVPESLVVTGCWSGSCSLTGDTLTVSGTDRINANRSVTVNYQFTLPVGTVLNLYEIE